MARPPLKAPSSLVPLLALLIVIGTLYFAREVLIPFSLAMLFAFILTPAVRQMEAAKSHLSEEDGHFFDSGQEATRSTLFKMRSK